MTSKELVTKALKFESVPRTPVSVLDGYLWMLRRNNMSFQNLFDMTPEESTDFILSGYDLMQSDILYANAQAGGAVREVMGGKADFSVAGSGPVIKQTALKSASDIKGYKVEEVFEKAINHELFKILDRQLELMDKKAGSEKYILAFGTGPLTTAAGMIGMEELMMALTEGGDDLRRIMDFSVELTVKLIKHQLDNGASAISIADPLSSINLISGEFFEKYSLPGLTRITDELKYTGAPSMLHICGDTTTRLNPVIKAGYDIFSVDAVDLETALKTAKGNYTIFGNLNTMDVMLSANPKRVYEIAEERCAAAGTDGGFILAPGCDLPPDTPLENIKAMVSAAHGVERL